MRVPRSFSGWTVSALGALALVMGVLGLVSPQTQLALMGFEAVAVRQPGDYTLAVLAITSLAAINTALLYLVGAVKQWPGFCAWAVAARILMGTGLAALALSGRGPRAFIGAAIWEGVGAVLLAAASLWDQRRRNAAAVGRS